MDLNISKINLDYGDTMFIMYKFNNACVDEERGDVSLLHCHEWYELHLLLDGEYEFELGNEKIPMKANDFLVIKPKTEHYSYKTMNSDFITISFNIKRKGRETRHFNYFKNTLDSIDRKTLKSTGEMVVLAKNILKSSDVDDVKNLCKLKCLYNELIFELFNRANGFCEMNENLKEAEIDYKITLDVMVNSPIYSLSDIADNIGYSERHTARLIKNIYGESLSDMRERRAMEKAKKILEESEFSIEEVATESGFESSAALRRAFKKREGITPLEFKQKILKKRTDF